MSDWFRNKEWSPEIEEQFFRKLSRARNQRSQYLRIQACYLTDNAPEVTLKLLGIYFTLEDHFDLAQAYCDEAHAYKRLGQLEESALSLEKALRQERAFPNLKTRAGFEYPLFVATHKMTSRYESALAVITKYEPDILLPVDRFHSRAALALILKELGDKQKAVAAANDALIAAGTRRSPFPRHPEVGLLSTEDHEIKKMMNELAMEDGWHHD